MYQASIVVPVLAQHEAWLRQCLLSALHQTVPCEVIVIFSPKTPASNLRVLADLGRHHHNLQVLLEPPNAAFAGALNAGIRRAPTERVGFLLSDDWLEATAVEACLRFSADIVSTGLIIYAANGTTRLGERSMSTAEFESQPTLEDKATYLKHFLLFVKARLLEIGGVDETIGLTGPDDYDLLWCLLKRGATVNVTGRPLYNYRDHHGQRLTLRAKADQVRDLQKILDKHGVRGDELQSIIERRSAWYGEPLHVVEQRQGGRR